jgi:hypothetical protein
MYRTQPRELPTRTYEPNIIHNPFTWMGVWTPHGWRIHRKRWGKAQHVTKTLSGDGVTTFFPEALLDPDTGKVEWQDDLHLTTDHFTDGGIYASDPRVEYPAGRPRWAVSHTLLCYPVQDHTLYTHEYRWDMVHGHLQTHFRKHVICEKAKTDSRDGKTVRVQRTPISRVIEGNVEYPICNSAVRGVWAGEDKSGPNLYTKRVVQHMPMHNHVYGIPPRTPMVQCYGVYEVFDSDPISELFDADTGDCLDRQRLIDQCNIPLDEPKIGMSNAEYGMMYSKTYEGMVNRLVTHERKVDDEFINHGKARLGAKFEYGKVGYGHKQLVDSDHHGYEGSYCMVYDLDDDGVITEQDIARLEKHRGRLVRFNLLRHAYWGGNWVTGVTGLTPHGEPTPPVPIICDYDYGGGYDAQAGVIHLLDTPGPNKDVWVEYHHDAPADAGENNIVVHLYREID